MGTPARIGEQRGGRSSQRRVGPGAEDQDLGGVHDGDREDAQLPAASVGSPGGARAASEVRCGGTKRPGDQLEAAACV